MAKKKSEKSESAAPSKKKTTKATKPPATAPSTPMIDTGLAANSAAKLIAAKASVAPGGSGAPSQESASFKNLKQSLNKHSSTSMASFLDKTAGPGQKRPNLPAFGGKQVGRNQTFGADVNRSGVPRRTGG